LGFKTVYLKIKKKASFFVSQTLLKMWAKDTKALTRKFWLGCVPARLVMALVLYFVPLSWLPFFGVAALFGVAGLLYRTFTYDRQQVGVFKQPVTWNAARPVHALIWLVFAILAISRNSCARIVPFIDVLAGICLHRVLH
jgi:hypothetical protein